MQKIRSYVVINQHPPATEVGSEEMDGKMDPIIHLGRKRQWINKREMWHIILGMRVITSACVNHDVVEPMDKTKGLKPWRWTHQYPIQAYILTLTVPRQDGWSFMP